MSKRSRKGFTQIFNSFLDSEQLDQHDKMVFITIKSFAYGKRQSTPSLATISRVSGVSISQVRRCIKKLQNLKILKVEPRINEYSNGRMSNIYTLYDSENMWDEEINEIDDYREAVKEFPDDVIEEEFFRRKKNIKKEPVPNTGQSEETDALIKNKNSLDNHNMGLDEGQDRYPLDFVKKHFSYDIMIFDHPELEMDIDYVIKILYDTLNSSLNTIRVQKTDRPKEIVINELMKLSHMEIIYVIEQYREQTGRIKNPKNYILTQLYDAAGQMNADIQNLVKHHMEG